MEYSKKTSNCKLLLLDGYYTSGYTYVIATCQDAGTAILVASLSGTSLKVIFSNQITIARVNFLLLTA